MDAQKELIDCNNWILEQDDDFVTEYGQGNYALGLARLAWQAKAQAVPELTDKMIVAIESEAESQLKASAIDADPFRLDGEKIWYAALEAQEPK